MKFDNVTATTKEARPVALPLGAAVVTFHVKPLDIRSAGYQRVKDAVQKPYRHLIQAQKLDDITDRTLAITSFVRHCMVGWEGITAGGEPVPFNEENAIEFFTAAPTTFYDLITEAQNVDNYALTDKEAKNS